MRAIFQIIAFSFLIVTLLMLINFEKDYWNSPLAMLATKHCFDLTANTVDLTAFSKRSLHLMKYRIPFDCISTVLIIVVQLKLFKADDVEEM